MSVNIKVTGGLNIEWGQIDPKVTGGLNHSVCVCVCVYARAPCERTSLADPSRIAESWLTGQQPSFFLIKPMEMREKVVSGLGRWRVSLLTKGADDGVAAV